MDIIFVVVILFATIIGLTAIFHAWDDIIDDLTGSSTINPTAKAQLERDQENIPGVVDNIFTLVLFGAFLSIVVAAYLIRSNFIFFFIAVFVLAIFIFITAILSNVYEDFRESDPSLDSYVEENFSMSNHIINNYVIYVLAMGILILIALYAKVTTNVEA